MAGEIEAAQEWQVQLVRDELVRATDTGEQRSRAQLQESCGLGAGDLEQVLEALRANGEATESAPDAFEAYSEEVREARLDARVGQIEADIAGVPEEAPGLPATLAEAERAAGRGAPSRGGAVPVAERRVELPMGVAGALDEAALGKIVKAGIDEAKAVGAEFVLVVTP